jgi:alkanesulfonate monooxygenase SsuD/methylene tetrahydromethanopterin reductase-like flavin-dependent oxidoreductase (luciferase family)
MEEIRQRRLGGQFVLGVGTGWRRDEIENLGYDFESRSPRMTDHLRALNTL